MFSEPAATSPPADLLTDDEAAAIRAAWDLIPADQHSFWREQLDRHDAGGTPRLAASAAPPGGTPEIHLDLLEDIALDLEDTLFRRNMDMSSVETAPAEGKQAAKDALLVNIYRASFLGPDADDAARDLDRDQIARLLFQNDKALGSDAAFAAEAKLWAQRTRTKRHLMQGFHGDSGGSRIVRLRAARSLGVGGLKKEWDTAYGQSLHGFMTDAAETGQPFDVAWGNFQYATQGKPGSETMKDADVEPQARQWYDQRKVVADKAEKTLRIVFPELLKEFKGGGGDMNKAVETLLALNDDERTLTFRYLKYRGREQHEDMGSFEAIGTVLGRTVGGFNGMASWRRALVSRGKFSAGQVVHGHGGVDQVRGAYGSENISRMGANNAIPSFYTQPQHVLTKEKAEKWNKEVEHEIEKIDMLEELTETGQQHVRAVTGNWFEKKLLHPAVEAIPTLLLMARVEMLPATLPLIADTYSNREYLRLKRAGFKTPEAMAMGDVTGALQAGMDFLLARNLFGKLPVGGRTIRTLTLTGGAARRFGVRTGGSLAFQTTGQLFKNHVVPAVTQDVMNSDPNFDPSWGQVWQDVLDNAGDTALGGVLLTAAFSASHTARDTAMIKAVSESRATMRLRGYTMDQIREIQSVPMEQRGALLAKYELRKAPTGAEREALINEAAELAREESRRAGHHELQTSDQMRQAGITVEQTAPDGGDPRYRIGGPGAPATEHASPAEALAAAQNRLPATPPGPAGSAPPTDPAYGAANKLITRARYEASRARLEAAQRETAEGKRLFAGGLSPEQLDHALNAGLFHLEAKTRRTFTDWSAAMLQDFGESIRPHLPDIYRRMHSAPLSAPFRQEMTPQDALPAGKPGPAADTITLVEKAKQAIVPHEENASTSPNPENDAGGLRGNLAHALGLILGGKSPFHPERSQTTLRAFASSDQAKALRACPAILHNGHNAL